MITDKPANNRARGLNTVATNRRPSERPRATLNVGTPSACPRTPRVPGLHDAPSFGRSCRCRRNAWCLTASRCFLVLRFLIACTRTVDSHAEAIAAGRTLFRSRIPPWAGTRGGFGLYSKAGKVLTGTKPRGRSFSPRLAFLDPTLIPKQDP